jgi:hypothetical protein
MSAAVTATQNSLNVSSKFASASHPSLPEINIGTSAAADRADNNQVAQVSEPSGAVRADGALTSPKRARILPEVRPAAELFVLMVHLRQLTRRQLCPQTGGHLVGPKAEAEDQEVGAGLPFKV